MSRYTEQELRAAVAISTSWRGVLRELGLAGTSAGSIHSVRRRADLLGLDYQHFRGRRRWSDDGLRKAVAGARNWSEVAVLLQVDSTTAIPALRGHALRLKLDTGHLDAYRSDHCTDGRIEPHIENLDRAGTLLAAAWFTLCGLEVSWPLEPSRYDLIVVSATRVRRVQVKTTTVRAGRSWKVYLSTTAGGRKPYGPDEIDEFFIVTGDLTYYLIPFEAVGGLHAIHLSAYTQYRMVAA